MQRYDPLVGPDTQEWLALDEQERIDVVWDYHRKARIRLPNANVHAIVHAMVETQIALGDKIPVRRTAHRLMDAGLDRHETIHAIGWVLIQFMSDLMESQELERTEPNAAYFAALERLTVEDWRRAHRRFRRSPLHGGDYVRYPARRQWPSPRRRFP
jgi:hypothetical protein